MNHRFKIVVAVEINADKHHVWDALTNPEKIKLYLFGTEALTDWKAGSPLVFQGEYNGRRYRDKGEIIASEPADFLQYSYWSGFSGLEDRPENYSRLAFALKRARGKTTLTLTQTGFVDEQAMLHSQSQWQHVLSKLKELVESDTRRV
jgi:uncharacterized protein YndB with AHSA1/START domain